MTRDLIAYLIIALMVAICMAAVALSRRFARYEQSLRRGNHDAKGVWKPFWLP